MNYKFRGYDRDSKCWRYGYYLLKEETIYCCATKEEQKANEHHFIIFSGACDWNMPLPYYQSEVDGETIGQYIGINDKYHKEIYVGDIVECLRGDDAPYTVDVTITDIRKLPEELFGSRLISLEVIGNIYKIN